MEAGSITNNIILQKNAGYIKGNHLFTKPIIELPALRLHLSWKPIPIL